jgi:hypothetical protein
MIHSPLAKLLARVCYYYAKGAIADEKNSEKNKSRLVTLFYVNLFFGSKLNFRRFFCLVFLQRKEKNLKRKRIDERVVP